MTQAETIFVKTEFKWQQLPLNDIKYYSGNEEEAAQNDAKTLYTVVLNGEDPDVLAELAQYLEELFVTVDGVIGVKRNRDSSPNELALIIDRERSQRLGATPQLIASTVASGLRGMPLPRFHRDGKEVPVLLRFAEDDRESLAELSTFSVPTTTGEFVQLSSVTDVEYLAATRGIFRRGKRMSRTITVDLEERKADERKKVREKLDALVATVDLPEGVRFGAQVGVKRIDAEIEALTFAAVVSIIFIYFLMGFLFESFILPLSIIPTIPMAAIGVMWIHYITDRDIDFLGFVGVILLIGVVVNNGIVLIDYVNRLRAQGLERTKALLQATRHRFRPIMMTACTTISGMIPLTLGAPTSIGLSYKSFGLTLISGMVTATLLTLLVVPVIYTLLDDLRRLFIDFLRRILGRSKSRNIGRLPD
ncbi:MAG: efflux RND transporter permease subunit [Myxococcota bacterium]